jgi:hypothetical protein
MHMCIPTTKFCQESVNYVPTQLCVKCNKLFLINAYIFAHIFEITSNINNTKLKNNFDSNTYKTVFHRNLLLWNKNASFGSLTTDELLKK